MSTEYPVVLIEWEDAFATGPGVQPNDPGLLEEHRQVSVGHLIRRTRRHYVLAQSLVVSPYDPQSVLARDTLTLPRGVVRRFMRLKEDA